MVVAVPSAGDNSVALCHQLRTIDKTRVGRLLGDLSASDLVAVEDGVRRVYGLG